MERELRRKEDALRVKIAQNGRGQSVRPYQPPEKPFTVQRSPLPTRPLTPKEIEYQRLIALATQPVARGQGRPDLFTDAELRMPYTGEHLTEFEQLSAEIDRKWKAAGSPPFK